MKPRQLFQFTAYNVQLSSRSVEQDLENSTSSVFGMAQGMLNRQHCKELNSRIKFDDSELINLYY